MVLNIRQHHLVGKSEEDVSVLHQFSRQAGTTEASEVSCL